MTILRGCYFDGRTSRRRDATLGIYANDEVRLSSGDGTVSLRVGDLDVQPRLGNTPRSILLPDGGRFETDDNDAVDALLAQRGAAAGARWLHSLESRWHFVALSVAVVLVSGFAAVRWGIPGLARAAAFALPQQTIESIGEGSLDALDRAYFEESELDRETRARVAQLFEEAARADPDEIPARLLFRRGAVLGANAFALPSGVVVVTDELVTLAEHDGELVSVLAHEIGHLSHRHALRQVIQSSMVALLVILVTGDLSSTSSLVAAVPTLLVEASYSREFEWEADGYALEHLERSGIDPIHFANLMRRLDADAQDTQSLLGYFASHPPTPERVARFEAAAR